MVHAARRLALSAAGGSARWKSYRDDAADLASAGVRKNASTGRERRSTGHGGRRAARDAPPDRSPGSPARPTAAPVSSRELPPGDPPGVPPRGSAYRRNPHVWPAERAGTSRDRAGTRADRNAGRDDEARGDA
jgi:hypothetical protein